MSGRRGFALLTVLWVIAIAGAAAAAALATARLGVALSGNRIALLRAGWARDGCGEILQARFAADSFTTSMDTIELGRGVWCTAYLDDPGRRLDLNSASPHALEVLIQDSVLVAEIVARRRRRPFADVAEVGTLLGMSESRLTALDTLLSTRGTGRLNLGSAPAGLLATLPGMTDELLRAILAARAEGRLATPVVALMSELSGDARQSLLAQYQQFSGASSPGPTQLVLVLEGGLRGTPLRARGALTVAPTGGRLAVLAREVE